MEIKTNNMPLVSIIIPMYNAEKYIGETIESVVAQTYKNYEILIVDDCSTDNSIALVKKLENEDKRIKVIESKINFGGPAKPRNIGVENSLGEYIAFLDADDLWETNKLEIQLNYMLEYNYNFTSTNTSNIDNKSNNIDKKYRFIRFLKKRRKTFTLCSLIKSSFIATSSVMLKKNIFTKFDENKGFISVEDLYLWLQLFKRENIVYKLIREPLVKYRILSTSISERDNHQQEIKANLCILTFLLKNRDFISFRCYQWRILNVFFIHLIKKLIGK